MSGCGTHRYGNIDREKVDVMLRALRESGAFVSGNNPWEVNTNQSGVRLKGRLNEADSTLEVTVVARDWYVPCVTVWQKLDELVRSARAIADTEVAAIPRDTTQE